MQPSPTRVRHRIVLATTLVAVVLYLDRICVSMAETYIKQDLGLTDHQVGLMLSAFFWAYALAQVPSGWLADRFGGRLMLTIYVLTWSLFTGLLGAALGFVTLFALRLAIGAGQAGAYPTAGNLVSKWVPFSGRGWASAMISVGGRVGGGLAMLLTGYLIARFVPTTISSELASADLLNVPAFCHKLHKAAEAAAPEVDTSSKKEDRQEEVRRISQSVHERLSPEGRLVVQQLADKYGQAAKDVQSISDQPIQRAQLINDLNEIVRQADFCREEDLRFIDLPDEGKRFQRTLEQGGELPAPELTRRNRLLLEAVFPDSIKKIYVAGWRPVMLLYGVLGILVGGFFWYCLRDRPRDHPRCNAAELDLIERGRPAEATSPDGEVGRVPWRALMASRSLWLCSAQQIFTNMGWIFVITWLPRYLETRHAVSVEERGLMAFVPLAVGWIAMLLGGRLTDRLAKLVGLRWGRALPMSLTRFTAAAAYLYCLTDPQHPWLAVAAFCVVTFSTDLGTASVWAYVQDVGGRNVGSVLGWGNMWGNFGAAIMPSLLVWIMGSPMHWSSGFLACAIAFILSGVAALGVDARVPVVREEKL